jgi:glycerophosphoryl diester phosphodiesterase
MKTRGIEHDVIDRVRAHGLEERTMLSSNSPTAVRLVADAAPELQRAIGYPEDRYGVGRMPWPRVAVAAGSAAARRAMRVRAPLLLGRSRATALAVHHALVSPMLVRLAHARGIPVLAWTVNDPAVVERLDSYGVDAISSDDPGMALERLAAAEHPA